MSRNEDYEQPESCALEPKSNHAFIAWSSDWLPAKYLR